MIVMITIRLSMNGESPMIEPVTGFRSGAPGISRQQGDHRHDRERGEERVAQAACLVLR